VVEEYNQALIIGAACSAMAAALHIGVVIAGPAGSSLPAQENALFAQRRREEHFRQSSQLESRWSSRSGLSMPCLAQASGPSST